MGSDDLLRVFRERGALLEGHFGLTSGKHSPVYLQCALVLQYPDLAREMGLGLSARVRGMLAQAGVKGIDVVDSPAVGGIVIGQEVAAGLGARAIFCERVDGRMTFRRGFGIRKGEVALAVEDVVTTGGSIREAVDLAEASGAIVVATASIVHRYTENPIPPTGKPHVALVQVHAPAHEPSACPLCQKGIPVEKPGSRHLSSVKIP